MAFLKDQTAHDGGAVLITGASSGVGEATARHLASLGHPVVLGARRTDRLAANVDQIRVAGGRAHGTNQMIDVNLRGTLHGIAAVLPLMDEQGHGQIINVAPVSAHRVDATAAVYSATKFAVRALSEGLRQETTTVRVTVINPGFTVSELTESGGDEGTPAAVRAATAQLGLPASAVAGAIAYAIAQPASVDVNEIILRPTLQG